MTSGIVQSQFYSSQGPNPVVCYGEALVSSGLVCRNVVNGMGLVTRGFLWQKYDIWYDNEFYNPLSTSWTNADATITTTWTNPQFGYCGDYPVF